jgi:hypothetical protein
MIFWCHSCESEVHPSDPSVCPNCGSDFLEMVFLHLIKMEQVTPNHDAIFDIFQRLMSERMGRRQEQEQESGRVDEPIVIDDEAPARVFTFSMDETQPVNGNNLVGM